MVVFIFSVKNGVESEFLLRLKEKKKEIYKLLVISFFFCEFEKYLLKIFKFNGFKSLRVVYERWGWYVEGGELRIC